MTWGNLGAISNKFLDVPYQLNGLAVLELVILWIGHHAKRNYRVLAEVKFELEMDIEDDWILQIINTYGTVNCWKIGKVFKKVLANYLFCQL